MNRYNQVVSTLPFDVSQSLIKINDNDKSKIQEIRLRVNKPIILMKNNNACFVNLDNSISLTPTQNSIIASKEMIERSYKKLCEYSIHSNIPTLTNGYITIKGGHRVGVCSTAIYKNGEIFSVKGITSLNIRISREFKGVSLPMLNTVYTSGIPSIILAGKPASGKTTVLRDIAYQLSSGYANRYRKIVIVDERSEIASLNNSLELNDVGLNTDVLNSFTKEQGIEIAVRTLSPDMIICDEIGTLKEVEQIKQGFSSGVGFIVSVHISSEKELYNKPQIKELLRTNEFDYIVLLKENFKGFEIYNASEVKDEIFRNFNDNNLINMHRY